jgi:acyl carrier protein
MGAWPALPLSLEQERMWLFDRLLEASVSYDAPISARLRGPLSLSALDAALGRVLARHESLRTRFPCRDGVPGQVIDPYQPRRIALVDLSGLGRPGRERALASVVSRLAAAPFDLPAGPVCRATVVRLAPDDHVLVLAVHHLAADLWSAALIIDELSAAYRGACRGTSAALPPLRLQAAELGAQQRARLTPQRLARERDYWRRRLAGAACVVLPADHPRPAGPGLRSHVRQVRLTPDLSQALRELGRSQGVTLFAVLLAGLHALIWRWAGHADLVTNSVTAGRRGRGAERVVGMLTECLILRSDASGDPAFRELAGRIHEVTLDALDHCPLPFAEVVAVTDPGRDLEPSLLRQIGFSLHNTPRPRPFEAGLVIEGLPEAAPGTGISEADLWLEVFDDGAGPLEMRLQMDDQLFEPASVRLTARRIEVLLTAAAARPTIPLSQLPLLSPTALALTPPAEARPDPGSADALDVREVTRLVQSVLGVRSVSGADNFFRLGGSSMDAVRLSAAIRAQLGARVPLYDLVTALTVEGIARAVGAARAGRPGR